VVNRKGDSYMTIVDKRNATECEFSDLEAGELFVIPANDALYLKTSSMIYTEDYHIEHIASNAVDLVNYDLHTFDPRTVVKPIYNATLVLK
jgi:hypothetical protein